MSDRDKKYRKNWTDYLLIALLALGCFLLLCSVFETNNSLVNGIVMGKVFTFNNAILLIGGSLCFCCIVNFKRSFSFNLADGLLLLLVGIVCITYDWHLNPEPEKLLFGGQLVMLWFMLRIILTVYPSLRFFFLVIIVCTGAIEALWGLQQLYGLRMSNHSHFSLTGSFFNPGPYSGYLAVILPLAIHLALRASNYKRNRWWETHTILYYFAWGAVALIVIVLPAGMSRTAWIAAIIASSWVYWQQFIGLKKTREWIVAHKTLAGTVFTVGSIILTGLFVAAFLMKQDSANGRLLMWKISSKTIMVQPVTGTGLGGFPSAYAETQANYFEVENGSDLERLVAGCPEYAFNEFLQIGVEQGLVGLFLFCLWIGSIIYFGIQKHQIGAVGSIIALLIFAFSSYPLQLPCFWILLVFCSVICVTNHRRRRGLPIYLGFVVAILSCGLSYAQKEYLPAYQKWTIVKSLYNNNAYEAAIPGYIELYSKLKHKPEFLFELGQCQSRTKQFDIAIEMFERASALSADPMIHYMIAKNKQEQRKYEEAETILIRAINILPERIYPYYLLSRLYSVPEFYHKDKLQAAIDSVLTKEPKVNSMAIREMRDEVKAIIVK
jgi:Lipid A core - O-antigen ligase and related enzymes